MIHALYFAKAMPSPAQKEAGNYKKTKLDFQGLPISIENDRGTFRRGTDRDGKPWATKMQHHYGYIRGTIGKDKDHVDCFVGEHATAKHAYVVHQRIKGKADAAEWAGHDEDKVMLGFPTEKHAREAYLAHYNDPKFLGPVTKVPMEHFKRRCREGAI